VRQAQRAAGAAATPTGSSDLPAAPAREPADEDAEHESGLRCKRDVGRDADDDAKRQAQHGSKRDRGSDAHARQCMPAASRWRKRRTCNPLVDAEPQRLPV